MSNPVYGIEELRTEMRRLEVENVGLRKVYQELAAAYARLAELGSRPPMVVPVTVTGPKPVAYPQMEGR